MFSGDLSITVQLKLAKQRADDEQLLTPLRFDDCKVQSRVKKEAAVHMRCSTVEYRSRVPLIDNRNSEVHG